MCKIVCNLILNGDIFVLNVFFILPSLNTKAIFLIFFIFIFCFAPTLHAQISGRVTDATSGEALPFVSILINNNSAQVVFTDIDGKFNIPKEISAEELRFSYVGYVTKQYFVENQKTINISIEPAVALLKTFEVKPGINPAHRIIRKTVENRKLHDPAYMDSYSCNLYSKIVFTGETDTTFKAQNEDQEDRLEAYNQFFDKQHLFMMETYSTRISRRGKAKETVDATNISGAQEATFLALALQFQPFSFYDDQVSIGDVSYLNPVSFNSWNNYVFELVDTLYEKTDTTFVITFYPSKSKTFNGLKGVLHISAPDFAIRHIIAEPNSEEAGLHLKIRQQYVKRSTGRWFPEQLQTELKFNSVKLTGYDLVGDNRVYIKNVVENPNISRFYDELSLEVLEDAGKKDTIFWKDVRIEDLDEREKMTFQFLDSLSKAEQFDKRIKGLQALLSGKVPIGVFDLELDQFVRFNRYEGLRLGLKGRTNQRISQRFSVGGKFAYGFRDEAYKYGADLEVLISKPGNVKLKFFFDKDLHESGNLDGESGSGLTNAEGLRRLQVFRFDMEERTGIQVSFRGIPYLRTEIFVRRTHLNPLFAYGFDEDLSNYFTWLEQGVNFRYAFREKLLKVGNTLFSSGVKAPVFTLNLLRGSQDFNNNEGLFTRARLRIDYSYVWRKAGESRIVAIAGLASVNAPMGRLFSPPGAFPTTNYRIISEASFETMEVNEFLSNRFASIHLLHRFGILFKRGNFQPRPVLRSSAIIGQLDNPARHSSVPAQAPIHGFYECGFVIEDIYKINFTGWGFGVFYRYGAYQRANTLDNLSLKLSMRFGS